MKREQAILICLAGSLSFLPPVRALTSGDNPYKGIVDRNAFNLAPPPPPPDATTNAPPSNIKLTGITVLFGRKQALLLVQDPGPGKAQESYILAEGERQEQVEIVSIDEEAGSVTLKNSGQLATLTFDKDGVKPTSAGGPTPPGVPPGGIHINGGAPGSFRQIPPPARNLRLPQNQQPSPTPQAQAEQPSPQSQAIINPFQNNQRGQEQNLEARMIAQALPMETNRLLHAAEIQQGKYPPLPPTVLSQDTENPTETPAQ